VEKVVEGVIILAEMEGVDSYLCQAAAYCHDLGRVIEEEKGLYNPIPGTPGHAGLGVIPTKEILRKVGIVGQDAKNVIEAVKVHQLKKYEGRNKIVLILQDADRKNGLGKWGVIRAMAFNLEMNIPKPSEKELDAAIDKNFKVIKKDPKLIRKFIENTDFSMTWYSELLNTRSAREYLKEDYLYTKKLHEQARNWEKNV